MLYPLSYGGGTSASDPREHPRRKGCYRLRGTQAPGVPWRSGRQRPERTPDSPPHGTSSIQGERSEARETSTARDAVSADSRNFCGFRATRRVSAEPEDGGST
jgi:hypothetical protein